MSVFKVKIIMWTENVCRDYTGKLVAILLKICPEIVSTSNTMEPLPVLHINHPLSISITHVGVVRRSIMNH